MYQPCLNCGSPSFREKYYITRHDRRIVECVRCGLVQVNPRHNMLNFVDHEEMAAREEKLHKLFGVMVNDTDQTLKEVMERETFIKREHFKLKIQEIERYCQQGKLLDVGCAQGALLAACETSNFEPFGVEPSKYTYEESKKLAPHSTIYNCTLLEAQFPDKMFDVVTIINTLEHLLQPKETLIEIYRILKPGGLIVVETPNVDHRIPRILGRRWIQFLIPDHVVFFSKDLLTAILEDIGFEVRESHYPCKRISIRLLLFHINRYFKMLGKGAAIISEKMGIGDKTLSFPQFDEMVLLATKRSDATVTREGQFEQ